MRHLIRFLAFLLLGTSVAAIPGSPVDAQEIPAIAVDFELDQVNGLTFVEASERVVVVGDDEVLIFGLDGTLLHRVTGIGGASGAEAWGSQVVTIAKTTHELVVIDTVSGEVSRRIQSGAQSLNSVAVAGDTAWFVHGAGLSGHDGIGRVDLATGALHPTSLRALFLNERSVIEVSAGLPGSVFFFNPGVTSGYFRIDEDGGSLESGWAGGNMLASETGEVLWSANSTQLETFSTATMTDAGITYPFTVPRVGRHSYLLAGHDDRWLAAEHGRDLYLFSVGQSQPVNRIRFRTDVVGVDVSADRLFAIDGPLAHHGRPIPGAKTLWITPHNFERRQRIQVGIDAHGTPSGARPNLTYSCSDGSSGQINGVPYGWWTALIVGADVSSCRLQLSHVGEPHRTYLYTGADQLVENTVTTVEVTGDVGRDVAVFLQVLRSPINDATTFVEQQYHDILQRYPDPAGVQYWANLLETGRIADYQMVQQFVESPEFLGSMSPAMRLYLAYFGRWPDDAGLDYWANAIRFGTQVAQISDFFASSPEFMARYGSLSNRDFVTLVYTNVLGRSPDAAGYNFWLGRMSAGMSRGQVMTNFSESPEYVAQTRSPITVRSLYLGLLQREPDAAGFAFWTQRNQIDPSLAPLIVGFLDSDEYADRFWFWDDGPLPVTQAGALKRSNNDAVEMTRCDGRCETTGAGWLEAATLSLTE